MDRPPLHFSRLPLPQQQAHGTTDDARFPPLSSAAYSSQPGPERRDLAHNDPFFSRRPTYDQRASSTITHERVAPYEYSPTSRYPPQPFPPSSSQGQPGRRGSYGSTYSSNERRAEVEIGSDGQKRVHDNHTLPPPASDSARAGQPIFSGDHQRRSSFSTMSRPLQGSYGGQDQSSPLPPSFFGTRPMPPPTSPPFQQSSHVQPARSQPARSQPVPSPIAHGQPAPSQPGLSLSTQLPVISSLNRPGSSMSISSIIGIDSESTREAQPPRSNGYSSASLSSSIPRHASDHMAISHTTTAQLPRARTPESYPTKQTLINRPSRAYSGGDQKSSYFAQAIDSSAITAPATSQTLPNAQALQFGIRTSALDERPNGFQPHANTNDEERGTEVQRTIAGLPTENHSRHEVLGLDMQSSRRNNQASDESRAAHQAEDRRSPSDKTGLDARASQPMAQPTAQPAASEAHLHAAPATYPFLFRSSQQTSTSQDSPSAADEKLSDRSAEVSESRHLGANPTDDGDALRRVREVPSAPASHSHSAPESAVLSRASRQISGPRSPSLTRHRTHPHPNDPDHNQDSADDSFRPRHLLGHLLDNKAGRLSPLPQAVQGAQARMRGPSHDSGVKSEFARMFSGIGSGSAASTPQPVETQPPPNSNISSPVPGEEPLLRNPLLGRGDLADSKVRNSSRVSRRGRKIREDDDVAEDLDGHHLVRTNSGRGTKRSRPSYVSSNMTPHAALIINDALGGNGHAFSTSVLGKRTFIPGGPSSLEHPQSHASLSQSLLRKPRVTINNTAVFESMRHRKRSHLGSTVYAPVIQPASSKGLDRDSTFGYEITPVPLPRYYGMENCTVTIRVPRMFLERAEREAICRRRALWGAELYTDDSDPVAAAIHSGWIRGEWSDDIDLSMLDLGTSEGRDGTREIRRSKGSSTVLTEPPATPMMPMPNMDLQINLLILPALVSYASLVCHGLKSRPWASRHDGLSYKVDSIAWVDEKSRIGEERGGEARRKKLRAMIDSAEAHQCPSFRASFRPTELNSLRTAVAS